MNFVSNLLNNVDSQVNDYVFAGYHAVVNAFSLPLTTLFIIYFAGLGWLVIRALLPLTPMAVAWHMLKATFIFAFALHWDYFSYFFVAFFLHGIDRLLGAMLGALQNAQSTTSITDGLVKVWETGTNVFANLWRAAGTDSMLATLLGLIGYLTVIGIVGMALFYIVTAKIAVSVLLVLAPVILPMYLWVGTRDIFNGWLQLLVQWLIAPLLLYMFAALFMQLLQTQIDMMAVNTNTATISAFVLLGIIVMATFRQAGYISYRLAKKIHIGDNSAAGGVDTIPQQVFRALRK